MTNEKLYLINDIESLKEDQAAALALETLTIKGHTVYLVDFGGYFGYSALVFCDGRQITHANDYQLHHSEKSQKDLRDWYIETMNNKLFLESEIDQPLHSYSEYERKNNFLRNYYPQRREYESIFCINPSEAEKAAFAEKTKTMSYNPVAFCYMADADFVKKNIALETALGKRYEEAKQDYDYLVSAFYSEMSNHEYCYNWQADYDVLSVFGNIRYAGDSGEDEIGSYFQQLGYGEVEKKAYYAARKKYFDSVQF